MYPILPFDPWERGEPGQLIQLTIALVAPDGCIMSSIETETNEIRFTLEVGGGFIIFSQYRANGEGHITDIITKHIWPANKVADIQMIPIRKENKKTIIKTGTEWHEDYPVWKDH